MSYISRRFVRVSFNNIAILISLSGLNARAADSFPQKLDRLLLEHPLIRMVDADVTTAEKQVDVERSAYYPKFSIQSYAGREESKRDVGTSKTFSPHETSVQINQLLTDFGVTSARVDAARSVVEKEGFERNLQTQNLILAAVEAQLKLIRARKAYQFARESEATVLKQTQLENARVEAGRGYATDVLQAKAQLAGAEARRVSANLQLSESINRYKAVFGESSAPGDELQGLTLPQALLPISEEALNEAVQSLNPDTQAALARQRVALSERKAQVNKELMPRADLVLSSSKGNSFDGSRVINQDDTRMVARLNWSFDFGLRATHISDATQAAVTSATEKANYVLVQAREEARSAWANWQMSRDRFDYLNNQVNILDSFLVLARRERELGRRSLLDILNGEIGLINARSEALTALIDERIAAFRVVRVSGKLDVAFFTQPGVLIDASEWGKGAINSSSAGVPEKAVEIQPTQAVASAAPATPDLAPKPSPTNTEAQTLVEKWRTAWSSQDIDGYLVNYSADFVPANGLTHRQWLQQRRQRIASAGVIRLQLNNIRVAMTEEGYSVEFDQQYSSSQISDSSHKRLFLRKEVGGLVIVKEQVLDSKIVALASR